MKSPDFEGLGAPSLDLFGLKLWIHGREFPNATDFWDGNWLHVTAILSTPTSMVRTEGPIVHLREIYALKAECAKLYETLSGQAVLSCMEPNLSAKIIAGTGGHIEVEVSVVPDQLTERHEYKTTSDQTFLPSVVRQCEDILEQYPIREPSQLRA
jgi:hypothetical protein